MDMLDLEADRIKNKHSQLWDEHFKILSSADRVLGYVVIGMLVYMQLIVYWKTYIAQFYPGLGTTLPTACLVALITGIYIIFCWVMVHNQEHSTKIRALCRRLRSLKQEADDLHETYSNAPNMDQRFSMGTLLLVRLLIDADQVRNDFASHCRTTLWLLALYAIALITLAIVLLYEIRIFSQEVNVPPT